MNAYIVDTETTGEDPIPEVIELAIIRCNRDPADEPYTPVFCGFFKPTGRILFSAMAVHHILPEELAGEPDSATAKTYLPADMEYMIGHNVDYDWKALGQPACKRICTLAISRFIWPGNDGHSQSALAYQLSADLAVTRELLRGAHGATVDVEICHAILRAMLDQPQLKHLGTWEALYQFSENARVPRYWTFGKHKDSPIQGTDAGYLGWCLRQDFIDEYVKAACRLALKGQLT